MNRKIKSLSAILCGLVLTSGLCMTNVQAKSNIGNSQSNYTISCNQQQPDFGAVLSQDFRSDGTVKAAHVSFKKVSNAVRYVCKYTDIVSETTNKSHNYNLKDTGERIQKVYVPIPRYNGNYTIKLTAYDSYDKVISSEVYQYRYVDGDIALDFFDVLPV